jgi:mono/diheme cytochrome c family protein
MRVSSQTAGAGAWRPGAVPALLAALLVFLGTLTTARAEAPPEEAPAAVVDEQAKPPEAPAADAPEAPTVERDRAAGLYLMKCAGCHSIGGGGLSGPDLKVSASRPRQTVWDAIKRMEKNVGPLGTEDIDLLADFLLGDDAASRLDAHRKQVQLHEAASLEPGNPAKGQALFFGRARFDAGALACAACHQAGGRGGNLAVPLEDAFTRIGADALVSTTMAPGFPVMRAVYEPHPVTRQEAEHLVRYLESVAGAPQAARTIPLHLAGVAGSVVALLALGRAGGRRAAGTRARMVAAAHQRQNQGCGCGRKS